MDKKGQGISMEFIIIAAISLIVLVVIILFFTGGLQSLFQQQKEAVAGATDQQKEIWRGQCKLYCSLGQKENFIDKKFKAQDNQEYTCKSLEVTCGKCSGAEAGCSQQKDAASCTTPCSWEAW